MTSLYQVPAAQKAANLQTTPHAVQMTCGDPVLRPLAGVLHYTTPVANIHLDLQQLLARIGALEAATLKRVASSATSRDQQMPQLTGNSNTCGTSTQILDAAAMQMFISTAAVAATAQGAIDTSDSKSSAALF